MLTNTLALTLLIGSTTAFAVFGADEVATSTLFM